MQTAIHQHSPASRRPHRDAATMPDQRPDIAHLHTLQRMANQSARQQQLATIQAMAVTQMVRTKKDQIKDLGYTDDEADTWQSIFGGWVVALQSAKKLSSDFFRLIVANHATRAVRLAILNQLSPHYYSLANVFVTLHGGSLEGMVLKGLNNELVESMVGTPIPPVRALVIAMSTNPAYTAIGALGTICEHYPSFAGIVSAQMGIADAEVQKLIHWLGSWSATVLGWLEDNRPDFATLQELEAQRPREGLLGMLAHFAKEAAPGNDVYEAIGTQQQSYRIGHFARKHTLRGMPTTPGLDTTKTQWPAETTVDELRDVFEDFDDNTLIAAYSKADEYYTPTVVPNTQIRAKKNLNNNYFDQAYPTSGEELSPADAEKLADINTAKNDWTEMP
ncbi:hypothetical protein GJ699_27155 [Duganella sp. FT80W]|uniref:Uncharacterized protein n=1 Tax=Duganella guangzhouensis TaxID=2666084 RepID=A0A6I2L6A3_9BURK|nr:hypothetical protein [Duganella guangzhouensis]MRW93678.1 hypothetical protein [Duganella guangzhouensis]